MKGFWTVPGRTIPGTRCAGGARGTASGDRTAFTAAWWAPSRQGSVQGRGIDYLQCQQPNAFQRFVGVHFNFLHSGKNSEVFDVLASQVRALRSRQADRAALTSRTRKRVLCWGASGLTLMVLAILNACKHGSAQRPEKHPVVKASARHCEDNCSLRTCSSIPPGRRKHPSCERQGLRVTVTQRNI